MVGKIIELLNNILGTNVILSNDWIITNHKLEDVEKKWLHANLMY